MSDYDLYQQHAGNRLVERGLQAIALVVFIGAGAAMSHNEKTAPTPTQKTSAVTEPPSSYFMNSKVLKFTR